MSEILLIGGSGVLGRALLEHLDGHDVVATTRSAEKLALIDRLGARGAVCDVYDAEAVERRRRGPHRGAPLRRAARDLRGRALTSRGRRPIRRAGSSL